MPRGRIPTPSLWPLHVSSVHDRLRPLSRAGHLHLPGLCRIASLFADDVACAPSHRGPRSFAESTNTALDERKLSSNVGKSCCMVFAPCAVSGTYFWRRPEETTLDTGTRDEALVHMRGHMVLVHIIGGRAVCWTAEVIEEFPWKFSASHSVLVID